MTLCEGKTVGISMIFREKKPDFSCKDVLLAPTNQDLVQWQSFICTNFIQFSKDPKNPEHVSSVRAFFKCYADTGWHTVHLLYR